MTFFRNIFRSIYFVIILFFETLINFLIGLDWIVISPFFLLIYFVSTKRFDNQNIIPLVIVASDADNVIIDPKIGPIQGVQPKANAPPTNRGNIKLSLKLPV